MKSFSDDVRRRSGVVAVSILLLAFFLRVRNLGAESAWIDEAYSIVLSQHSIPQIIQGTAADQHPPLYYLLLHFWLWFGSGVYFARFFSVVIGLINVAQFVRLGHTMGVGKVGWGAGLLLSISPMHIWYSQEVRMYVLLAALTTGAITELWRCLRGENRWWAYGLLCFFAIYTQYFAVFMLMGQAMFVIGGAMARRRTQIAWRWIQTIGLVALGFSMWFPTALMQARLHTLPWISSPNWGDVRDTMLMMLWGSQAMKVPDTVRSAALAAFGLITLWAAIRSSRATLTYRSVFVFVGVNAVVPIAVITIAALNYPLFQTKQFLFLVGPLLLWIVLSVHALSKTSRFLAYAVVLMVAAISLFAQQSVLTKDDWRGASAYIQGRYRPNDVVYGNPAAAALPLSLYLDSQIEFDGYPPHYDILEGGWKGTTLTPEIADRLLRAEEAQHQRIWLVESYPEFWDPEGLLETWLEHNARLIDEWRLTNIRIRLYQFKPLGLQ